MTKTQKKLRSDFKELKLRLPIPWPVELSFKKLTDDRAAAMKERKDHLEIQIDSGIKAYDYLCDLLVHEYAHCLDWTPGSTKWLRDEHDSIFGDRWALVYRTFYGVS